LWRDPAGVEHGLIASLDDLGNKVWANPAIKSATIGASNQDGAANTAAIISQPGGAGLATAAGVCDAYANGTYTDWYLPAIWELNQLYEQAMVIDLILTADNDPLTNGLSQTVYWSSTIQDHVTSTGVSDIEDAWDQTFRNNPRNNDAPGMVNGSTQHTNIQGVRAVRRF
jgi:hypothetical protein